MLTFAYIVAPLAIATCTIAPAYVPGGVFVLSIIRETFCVSPGFTVTEADDDSVTTGTELGLRMLTVADCAVLSRFVNWIDSVVCVFWTMVYE